MRGSIITESGTGFRLWIADRRIGKTADGRLTDNMNLAQTLVCGVNGSMPLDDAIRGGFVDVSDVGIVRYISAAEESEPKILLDDSELTDGYMYNGELVPPNGYKSRS